MKPYTRTPYELRLEILNLALAMASVRYQGDCADGSRGTPPSTDEVIAIAKELNKFVSDNGACS